jgi:hypothetical protein
MDAVPGAECIPVSTTGKGARMWTMKMTPEQKRIEQLESALKVIATWAGYHKDRAYQDDYTYRDVLRDIDNKAREALYGKGHKQHKQNT